MASSPAPERHRHPEAEGRAAAPAITLVEVSRLFDPALLIEINAVAAGT